MPAPIDLAGRRLDADEVCDLLATDHPMVERFRFDKQEQTPASLRFTLTVIPRRGVRYRQVRDARGRPMAPVWRTLGGDERIGEGIRRLWVEGDELAAENMAFFPDQTFNDLGIASALYVAMERLYRALGVRRVTLLAVEVGIYAWARQGFAFLEPTLVEELTERLELFLFSHKLGCAVEREAIRESWDLASYDLPGRAIEGDRVGKAFMLRGAPRWHGIKDLDDHRQAEVAERSRRETFARLPDKIDGAPPLLKLR
jgi:hypothetical protein